VIQFIDLIVKEVDQMAEAPPERLGAVARRLVRGVSDRTRRELAAAGYPDVRPVHNLVFALVGRDGARITDMAARLRMTKQAVTAMVDHLEARGYVRRVPDPGDGRAKLVELTERGIAAAETSWRVAEGIERDWAQRLGPEALAAVKDTLTSLADDLEPGRGPPSASG
jgi:DNA-binding MarR family transcriptional regulator